MIFLGAGFPRFVQLTHVRQETPALILQEVLTLQETHFPQEKLTLQETPAPILQEVLTLRETYFLQEKLTPQETPAPTLQEVLSLQETPLVAQEATVLTAARKPKEQIVIAQETDVVLENLLRDATTAPRKSPRRAGTRDFREMRLRREAQNPEETRTIPIPIAEVSVRADSSEFTWYLEFLIGATKGIYFLMKRMDAYMSFHSKVPCTYHHGHTCYGCFLF